MADEQHYLAMVAAADEEQRLQGLKGLASCGIEKFLPQLYRALGDESWRIRKEGAELFLGLPSSIELAAEIIELLHSQDNAGLRNTAVDILVRLGRNSLPYLLEELHCPDHDVRKFVLDILGAIGAEEAVPGMIACLTDSDSNVRAASAENLGLMRVSEAIPHLLRAMADADLMLRFTILEALAQIGGEIPVAELLLYSPEKLLRQALFDCLGHVGDSTALQVLLDGISDAMHNVREAACLAVERISRRYPDEVRAILVEQQTAAFSDALAALLDSRRTEVRRAAVHLLGWVGNQQTAMRLLPLLGDEELSREAASALIAVGRESACSLTALWPDADARTRSYLAYILGEAGCQGCDDLLMAGLADSLPDLQQASAHAMGLVGGERSPQALADRLPGCDAEIAETLVLALSRLSGRFPSRVLESTRGLLEDEAEQVRSQAVNVLACLHDDEVDELLAMALKDVAAEVRSAAIKACDGRDGEQQWQSLLIALTDEQSDVRRLAVEVIASSGRDEAADALQLAMQDEDIWVRAAAVRSLVRCGSPLAPELLVQALDDPVGLVVIAALESLCDLDMDAAFQYLVRTLGHEDEEVVTAALKQLSYSGRADWIPQQGEALLNHRNWEVRLAVTRALVELAPEQALPLLESRLPLEGEELVRQQLRELIEALRAMQG